MHAVQRRMHDPAHMPQLRKYAAAGFVHGIRDSLPLFDPFSRPKAAGIGPTASLEADMRRLRQDQPGGSTLRVIGRHQVGGNMIAGGAAAGERGHPDAVWTGQRADLNGVKERGHGFLCELILRVSPRAYTTRRFAILRKPTTG